MPYCQTNTFQSNGLSACKIVSNVLNVLTVCFVVGRQRGTWLIHGWCVIPQHLRGAAPPTPTVLPRVPALAPPPQYARSLPTSSSVVAYSSPLSTTLTAPLPSSPVQTVLLRGRSGAHAMTFATSTRRNSFLSWLVSLLEFNVTLSMCWCYSNTVHELRSKTSSTL